MSHVMFLYTCVYADVLCCVQHPYLLSVYELASLQDYVSVVQKFVHKGSVRDIIYNVVSYDF